LAALYVLSGILLLGIPIFQIRLHRQLARGDTARGLALWSQNHLLLGLAALAAAGVYYCVDPEANIRVDLLLALPLMVLVVLLWAMFVLQMARRRQ